jgi:hypothetical protein
VARRIISTAANHFGALGAGSPSGVNLPDDINIEEIVEGFIDGFLLDGRI